MVLLKQRDWYRESVKVIQTAGKLGKMPLKKSVKKLLGVASDLKLDIDP